jgi:predicted kinase
MLTVVTGPPCAGKTTYVRNNAKPGDIIIDFDPGETIVRQRIAYQRTAIANRYADQWYRQP